MWSPGLGELIVIFVIVLVLFGGKKLPGLAKGLGQGIFEFRKGISGQEDKDNLDLENPVSKEISEDASEQDKAPKTKKRKKA